ncbi:hypothetical protein BaRGS_00002802 [Batillaria attramentaria]|uniref:Uncharacterized protein n=1 Tax=Batillaria attramentaria TaxID=370345 RepID=A0ABD0M2U7_9CAEN
MGSTTKPTFIDVTTTILPVFCRLVNLSRHTSFVYSTVSDHRELSSSIYFSITVSCLSDGISLSSFAAVPMTSVSEALRRFYLHYALFALSGFLSLLSVLRLSGICLLFLLPVTDFFCTARYDVLVGHVGVLGHGRELSYSHPACSPDGLVLVPVDSTLLAPAHADQVGSPSKDANSHCTLAAGD